MSRGPAAVVLPSPSGIGRLRPIGARAVSIDGGFWAERRRVNRTRSLAHGYEQLQRAGTLDNLRLAAGAHGTYRAMHDTFGLPFPFVDSDVYKWLEAVGWELGRQPDPAIAAMADSAIALVAAAQRPDGYLNSYVQVVGGGVPYRDLAWGHEFYTAGHLLQAAVAWKRSLDDDRLLDIATRVVDHIDREFGPGRTDGIDGHPEIEMALVELWRLTGERRHLDLAARFIDLRGHGLITDARFGSAYWQDHLPVREAPTVAGHAVRQLYLDSGAVDVAVETGDRALLDAVIRRWTEMVETRRYVTGGVGARHRDEAFGEPFELPPDEAYNETCASIASVMLSWRLLLATGEARFADAIERTMFNGMLSGVALDGTGFFYTNPLLVHAPTDGTDATDGNRASSGRKPWYPCACCPPNVMRTLATWEQYLATTDDEGVHVHQFATGTIEAEIHGGAVRLEVATDYPWDGRVTVRVAATPAEPWTLGLRIPPGARDAAFSGPAGISLQPVPGETSVECRRRWHAGDTVVLAMDLRPTVTPSDRRVAAIREQLVIERGPIVHCLEGVDLPDGVALEDVSIDAAVDTAEIDRPDLGESVVGLSLPATARRSGPGTPIQVTTTPYYAWANRGAGAMRVWVPTTGGSADKSDGAEG